jgi:hypothetical protein
MKRAGHIHNEILSWLQEMDIRVSLSTLNRQLHDWGFRRRTKVTVSDELAERVNFLFHHTLLSDSQIASKITDKDGLEISDNQVQEIRLLFGWNRQTLTPTHTYSQQQLTQQYVRQLNVADALKLLNPEGVTSRTPGLRKKRLENYITAGPDYLWCLDGHDKLAQYGIEIYATVDAYSRKIIWFYVGNSNRTQLSVLRQYLSAVKVRGLCPSFIRTDKGTETIMLADAHFSLFTEAALAQH